MILGIVLPVALLPLALSSATAAILCALVLAAVVAGSIFGLTHLGSGLLIMAFATVPLSDVRPIDSLPFLELSDVFFTIGFVFLIPRFLGAPVRIPTPFWLGGIGLCAVGSLSALSSDQPGANFSHLLNVVIGVVVFPLLVLLWQAGLRTTMAAVAAYLVGNIINVIASLAADTTLADRPAGLTIHPNAMGICGALGLALVPFLFAVVPPWLRWLVLLAGAISGYGIWISGSRVALTAAVVLTLLYPIFRRSVPAALGVAALCFPATWAARYAAANADGSNALERLLGAESTEESNAARVEGARAGLDLILRDPVIGSGWLEVWQAHNIYLQVAAAVGILGLICFLMLLVPMLQPLATVPPPYGLLAAPALGMALIGLADPAVGIRYIWSVVALALTAERLWMLQRNGSAPTGDAPIGSAFPATKRAFV